MSYSCFKCNKEVKLSSPTQVGRRDTCPGCSADMHCCLNCKHHDLSAYNQCREPQADRVLDKDRSNFCDYFEYVDAANRKKADGQKEKTLKGLDALFK